MSDTISLRVKSRGCILAATPNAEITACAMREDVRNLAEEWANKLGLKQDTIAKTECEFVLQSTLAYIEKLEGVLQRLQSDPDTPDDLMEEIERVLN